MKTVYLVRHGQTDLNVARSFNTPTTPLSEKGREQAAEIAKRCEKLPIDLVVASSMTRAKETAEIVNARINSRVEVSDLFIEPIYTSRFYGRDVLDKEVQEVVELYYANYPNPDFRYEDGENFSDLKKRALACLAYLENRSEENILVVSHAFFSFIIVAAAIYGEELSGAECQRILGGFDLLENTALSVLVYGTPTRKAIGVSKERWQLKVWNDHAHLG